MRYIKWLVLGAAAGLVMLLAVWLVRDIATRAAVVAGTGAALAGIGRWLLTLLRVSVDLTDRPSGKCIKVIDLPGAVGRYLVIGVHLAGACLFLGYVEFR